MNSIFEFLYNKKNKELEKDHVGKLANLLDNVIINLQQQKIEKRKEPNENQPRKVDSVRGILKKRERVQTPFQNYLSKKDIEFTSAEQEIQEEIQDELLIYVRELVENYVNKKKVKINNMLKYTTLAVNQIYKKLFLIALSIFMLDKEMFFNLTRQKNND